MRQSVWLFSNSEFMFNLCCWCLWGRGESYNWRASSFERNSQVNNFSANIKKLCLSSPFPLWFLWVKADRSKMGVVSHHSSLGTWRQNWHLMVIFFRTLVPIGTKSQIQDLAGSTALSFSDQQQDGSSNHLSSTGAQKVGVLNVQDRVQLFSHRSVERLIFQPSFF